MSAMWVVLSSKIIPKMVRISLDLNLKGKLRTIAVMDTTMDLMEETGPFTLRI